MENNNDYVKDYLMHHGIKGMKWGIRREDVLGIHDNLIRKKEDLKTNLSSKVNATKSKILKENPKLKNAVKKIESSDAIKQSLDSGKKAATAILNSLGAITFAPIYAAAKLGLKSLKPVSKSAREVSKAEKQINKDSKSNNVMYDNRVISVLPYGKEFIKRFGIK